MRQLDASVAEGGSACVGRSEEHGAACGLGRMSGSHGDAGGIARSGGGGTAGIDHGESYEGRLGQLSRRLGELVRQVPLGGHAAAATTRAGRLLTSAERAAKRAARRVVREEQRVRMAEYARLCESAGGCASESASRSSRARAVAWCESVRPVEHTRLYAYGKLCEPRAPAPVACAEASAFCALSAARALVSQAHSERASMATVGSDGTAVERDLSAASGHPRSAGGKADPAPSPAPAKGGQALHAGAAGRSHGGMSTKAAALHAAALESPVGGGGAHGGGCARPAAPRRPSG